MQTAHDARREEKLEELGSDLQGRVAQIAAGKIK